MAFSLCDFDAIGFDVDHAFVQYRLENIFPVSSLMPGFILSIIKVSVMTVGILHR
jgi:hypothetical protein